jgi:magnesium-protoporphyrin IX monomethyl ester (oxidative) cyclase
MILQKKINKILLIQPPLTTQTDLSSEPKGVHPPLGLASLAAAIEKDYDVSILDAVVEGYETEVKLEKNIIRFGLTFEEIIERINVLKPDVVGVSNLFSSGTREALQAVKLVKDVDPDIITVMGGPHPSALPEDILSHEEVDFVIMGEGEYSFRDLLRGIESGDLSRIDGVAYRRNGEPHLVQKSRFIEDLDELHPPARHLLPMDKYFKIGEAFIITKKQPFTPLVTSRGCPARCTFCPVHATWGGKWRARSAESVLDEIESLVETYGVKEIHFDDDNLVLDRNRAQKIFQGIIERRLDIIWTVPTGLALWAVDNKLLELMKESGCYKLYVAVESGDENILRDVIRKPLDLKKIKPLVHSMHALGIEVESFFVVGMPGETEESLQRTFRFARDLDAEATHYFFANPMPGTELWEICKKNRYFREGFSFEKIRVERANVDTPQLRAEKLEKLVSKEQLIGRMIAFSKHPWKMMKKYLDYFRKDRRIVFNFLVKNIKESFKRK